MKKKLNFAGESRSGRVKIFSTVLTCLLFFISVETDAQLKGSALLREIQYTSEGGKVTVIQNSDITKLTDKHLYEAGKLQGIYGYRIRIYSNSGKEAYEQGPLEEAEFRNKYKEIKSYYKFSSPFYRLYVGDFRTRSEALKFLKKIEYDYPDAFIVRTIIDFPEL